MSDDDFSNWRPRPLPPRRSMTGRYCRVEPLDPNIHGDDLVAAFAATDPASWEYLFDGPFDDDASLRAWLTQSAASATAPAHAIVDAASNRAVGVASYMRIEPAHGCIEVGSIHYADAMKRSRIATEVMFLMMARVFDELGYRRYEWKCNALNAPSRKAALRLGFTFEGVFRQHMVLKGRSRDTAWFSIIDGEWPVLKAAYVRWLAPENFDASGLQRVALATLIAEMRER